MRSSAFTLLLPVVLLQTTAGAAEIPLAERLLPRLRPVYSQPTEFVPAAMRYPIRPTLTAELKAARAAVADAPTELEAHWKLATLEEAAENPTAEEEWRTVLGLIEAQLRKKPDDLTLLERQVEAMVGANVAVRVVAPAEKLAKAQPASWHAQLLLGDAYLRRADFNWRVLARVGRGGKALQAPQLLQLNDDLHAAERAYGKAIETAPAEPAPRAARVSLLLARPLMAALLPKGTLAAGDRPDLGAVWSDLLDLVRRNPKQVDPLWHACHFLATQGNSETVGSAADRKLLQETAASLQVDGPRRVLLSEARGLLAADRKDWETARREFEAASSEMPDRRFAADWLALAEVNSRDPREQVVARVRARIAKNSRSQDATALGILLAPQDRPGAIAALRQAIELDRDSAVARYNLAVLLAQQDVTSPEVRYHLERALQLQPDGREGVFFEAVLEALAGHEKSARQTLEGFLHTPDLDLDLKQRIQDTLKDLPPAKG
jgi:tetratricopeptide (TPR) repeat protein